MQDEKFLNLFAELQEEVYKTAVSKGWYDKPSEDGTLLCQIHSEVSEALEALRVDEKMSDKIPEFKWVEEELGDIILRVISFAKLKGYNVGGAMIAKKEYNKGRSHKHGGKKF